MAQKLLQSGYRTVRRLVIALVGTTVVLTGIALLVLPGPALIVIPAGLAILSLEFAFAKRWLRLARNHTEHALRTRNPKSRAPGQDDTK